MAPVTRPALEPDIRSGTETVVRALGPISWVIVVAGFSAGILDKYRDGGAPNQTILMATMTTFFVVQLIRLVLAGLIWPNRRTALFALAFGIALWSAASAILNASGQAATVAFPAPHEWLFFASYVGFSVFLGFDVAVRGPRTSMAWLDAAIICGGVGALAGAVLLTPFARNYPDGGLQLLVAVLYPLIDLVLALFVIGQWALASRSMSRRTVSLIGGFVALAVADASLVLNLPAGTYVFTEVADLMYGVGFLLIVDAACTRTAPQPRAARRLRGGYLVASFVTAVALLLVRPSGDLGWAVAVPAAVALLATGARLSFALRDSLQASEAFHLARTDDLTGLPNRRALLARIDRGLRKSEPLALLLLDLDGFKDVNDTLGHSAGDTLLELVALRMRDALDPKQLIARVGGDEFAIVVDGDDPVELMLIARGLRESIMAPMRVERLDLVINASFGIAVRQTEDTSAVDLLRRADVAMYEAKSGRLGVQLYDAEHDAFSRQRLKMGEELRRGIAKGQLINYYQPKIDALTQSVIGVEALVRWDHPEQGLIPPVAFLSIARRSGLMLDLSACVARQAILDAMQWHQAGLDLNVAINLAPPELLKGRLMPMIYEMRDRVGLPPELLTIEVTEDSFLSEPELARTVLLDIRAHGLRTSIDDFGTGFSSLAYLRDLPVSELKLDRSFVGGVATDPRSRLIVASTIDMAHALGLELVAEGVENASISAEVLALGADVLQGYHFSPPIPAARVADWARQWTKGTQVFRPSWPASGQPGS
jgi:diguanylate cyclase (GGDEF)-like protein